MRITTISRFLMRVGREEGGVEDVYIRTLQGRAKCNTVIDSHFRFPISTDLLVVCYTLLFLYLYFPNISLAFSRVSKARKDKLLKLTYINDFLIMRRENYNHY